jgi:hypothetical protein
MIAKYSTKYEEFVIEYDTNYKYSCFRLLVKKKEHTLQFLDPKDKHFFWDGSFEDMKNLMSILNLAKKDIEMYRKIELRCWKKVRQKMFPEEKTIPGNKVHFIKNKSLNLYGFFLYNESNGELRFFPRSLQNPNFLTRCESSDKARAKANEAIASIAFRNRNGKSSNFNSNFAGWELDNWYERGRKVSENVGIL